MTGLLRAALPGIAALLFSGLGGQVFAAVPAPWRGMEEVRNVLSQAPTIPQGEMRPLNIVLVANRKDHGPHEHDYPRWLDRWSVLLGGGKAGADSVTTASETGVAGAASSTSPTLPINVYGPPFEYDTACLQGISNVHLETARDWPSAEQFAKADVVVAYMGTGGIWNEEKIRDVKNFMERGGGFVSVHSAVIAEKPNAVPLSELIGLAWEGGYTLFRHGPVDLKITAPEHPITKGLPPQIYFMDETYWPLVGDVSKVEVLATADEVDREAKGLHPQPMIWTSTYGKGRAFSCILGHYSWTFDDPFFRILLLRGIAWAAGESEYRFDPLVLCGARVSDESVHETEKEKAAAVAPNTKDPDLLLWLDAADRDTVALTAEKRVSSWTNKAGESGVKLTASGPQLPLFVEKGPGGKPAIQFDGVDDVLRTTDFGSSATEWSIALVVTPRSNRENGMFHTMIAANKRGLNDYETGFNFDLGISETRQFSAVNLEGSKDAPGAVNLRTGSTPFGEAQIIFLTTGDGLSQLYVNGSEEQSRAANDAVTALEEVRIGGRFCHNREQGYFHGDVSEVLLYRKQLSDEQRAGLYAHLFQKYSPDIKPGSSRATDAWDYLPAYDWGATRRLLKDIDDEINAAKGNFETLKSVEAKLLRVLIEPSTAPGSRDFICRRLSTIGTEASVAALADLLPHDQHSTVALYALERIPGEQADTALLEALDRASGKLRIGIIDALGNRKVAEATSHLGSLLRDRDDEVRRGVIGALGDIGSAAAASILTRALKGASGAAQEHIAESLLKCAEQLSAADDSKRSAEIYETLSQPGVWGPARTAAARAQILSAGDKTPSLILKQLQSRDSDLETMALLLSRELPGTELTEGLAAGLNSLPVEKQPLLISALGDRKDTAAKAVIREAIASTDSTVSLSAISALGELGDETDIELLLSSAADNSTDTSKLEAVRSSLVRLSAPDVDATLLKSLENAKASSRELLIDVVGRRGHESAKPVLMKYAKDSDPAIRLMAIAALGESLDAHDIPVLVDTLLRTDSGKEIAAIEKAVARVHARTLEKELWLDSLLSRIPSAKGESKKALLRAIRRNGGPRGLEVVRDELKKSSGEEKDFVIRILCDWPTPEAADDLLTIARDSENETHRVLALRGYLRLAGNGYVAAKDRLAMVHEGLRLAKHDQERYQAVGTLATIITVESLKATIPIMEDETLREEAALAALAIGERLLPWYRNDVAAAADRVIQVTKNDDVKRRAEALSAKAKGNGK